ncbi:OmpA family protein [uncultured Bacteroides sp.]|uniref:OmpA family protein n=1 Tax=uncultured Bacteroides sp. TaxID=162156 RepID=UPI0025E9D3AF|nr:OmpA family protein [uncultured Bacteroides sp.]
MKKSIILVALALGAFTAVNAQTVVEGTKFVDNWAVEIQAGGTTPLTHSAFIKSMRPAFGVGFSKQLTPIFGLGFQGMGYVNTTPSKTAIDASDVSVLGKVNLMNLFSTYPGEPRVFEIEAVAGAGWLHYYASGPGDLNSWSTRFGMNLNFNMGESKAFTLALKPSIVYDMQGGFNKSHRSRFNANNASFELTAGLTYHFMASNGKHYISDVRVYNQAEIDDLNSEINALRGQVTNRDYELVNAAQRVTGLQKELEDCRTKIVPVATVVKTARVPESIITFRQGRSTVDASQLPNVERVASYMTKYPKSKVIIKGYASPEGSVAVNDRIAKARAEAVKKILVNKYKISPLRINAEGRGVGDMFTDPDWNRVSICTLED